MRTAPSPYEVAARMFESEPLRHRSPLALARALESSTRTSPALELIDRELVDLMADDSPHNALAVFIAAQEGKSTLCSRRLPEWTLDREPDAQIAIVSYQEDIAVRWGREIKRDTELAEPGALRIKIRRDSSAAGRWDTAEGGGCYCTGVGGSLTGRSVGRLLVIDDPVKDRAAAESQVTRDATWDWFESVALTRLGPRSRVVLIMTRFHEDDLAGRIFSRPGPLRWRTVKLPAIAEDNDPLGRQPGEELPSVRGREPGYFLNLRATMSPYTFSSMYQQSPTAPEGNFFRRAAFRYWREMAPWADGRERIDLEGRPVTLTDSWRFVTTDFAASTKSSADWTVAACWAVSLDGDLILLDRVRARVPDHQHFALTQPLIARWGAQQVYVEANWWSQAFVSDARDRGVPVALVKADKDKLTRAIPAAGRVHSGRVWFPAQAAWLDNFTDELAAFPSGTHDDQVDVLSYAAKILVNDWVAAAPPERLGISPWEQSINMASQSATGNGHVDPFDVPF